MVRCIWCTREFSPRSPATKSLYALLSAGVAICWSCSDLYDDAEVRMHFGPVKGTFDQMLNQVLTQNGHQLPVTIDKKTRTRWGRWSGHAVDSFGKRWSIKGRENHITLRPIGASK